MSDTVTSNGKTVREHLAELVHRYADAVVHRDGEAWGATWADDAVWVLGPGREVSGRPAIVELWNGAMARFEAVVQNVVNGAVEIDASGTSASGRWYILEHFRRVDATSGILLAFYDDTYTLTTQGWRFASRRLTVQYQGAPDLSDRFHNTASSS
jgi:ketosteroid isomerase-like protein